VLAPSSKREKKNHFILKHLFGNSNNSFLKEKDDVGIVGLVGGKIEIYPYVSFTINLET
jgi:hypothetical protein